MSKKKTILLSLGIITAICYWLLHLTEGVYYKTYSPYGEYSVYTSKYKYYKYLNLNFPSSRFGDASGRIYLYDEVNKKVISSCHLSMISDIYELEWFDTYLSNRGGSVYLKFPKPYKKEIIPIGYDKISEDYGDLDGDTFYEKVNIYNTNIIENSKRIRMLQIYKNTKGKWELWRKTPYAVLPINNENVKPSYLSVRLDNGTLLIEQQNSQKADWIKKDVYRFINNEFQLVSFKTLFGRTAQNHFKNRVKFNLETGEINYKRDSFHIKKQKTINLYSREMEEVFYKKGIHVTLQNRYKKTIKIISPKNQLDFAL